MLGSLALFLVLFALLAVRVRDGEDPALGGGTPVADVAPRRVIVHRVILRKVIVTEPAPRSHRRVAAPSGPVLVAPAAPAPVAQAPVAPAPARPAPAPVTTGSS